MSEGGGQQITYEVARLLLQILRLLRLHDIGNVTFEEPLEHFESALRDLTRKGGAFKVQSEGGAIYINKQALLGGSRAFTTSQALVKVLAQMQLAEISFTGTLAPAELRDFFGSVAKCGAGQTVDEVKEVLKEKGLFDKAKIYGEGEGTGKAGAKKMQIDVKTYFPLAYSRTLVLLREFVKNVENEELNRYFSQKLQRAIQEIVSLAGRYPNKLQALTTIKDADEFRYNHMVNTGILSILLGQQLGLNNVQLSELGFAALLHGLGKFGVERTLVTKEELARREEKAVGTHPYHALGRVLGIRQLSGRLQLAGLVAFQYDLHRGWTDLRIKPNAVHPYAMIVRICEAYDTFTTPLSDRPAYLSDQALQLMKDLPAGDLDPLMLKAFTNMLGLYPTGTVVQLTTGEVAVVIQPHPEFPQNPLVAVVRAPDGSDVPGDLLDLTERNRKGRFRSRISESVDPQKMGINVPDYLLG